MTLQDKKIFERVFSELHEKYVKASTELGKAKEYEFKVKLETKFTVPLNQYMTSDGQIEFDLVGKKKDVAYIVEIKWRNKPVNIKDILTFHTKVQKSDFESQKKRLFVLSKSGFDKKAIELAKKQNIICLDAEMNEIS
ncbi:MAG: restriction endonuclease [Euryarchaeota archaeon]|nr:restriction endonuclease [Euryarchaeota archaeon]